MKKNENKTAKRMQTIALCGCLCLVAVGAGVTYRAFDRSHLEQTEEAEEMAAAVQSPTVEMAALERNKRSNNPGRAPEAEPKKQETKLTFAAPLEGEVVLPYSIDHAVYDPTLEQYRTNASVSIAAEIGTEVKAAAEGKVQAVTEETETGRTVTIAHRDGWTTVYGQLEDGVQVKEGQTVAKGQTIGTVHTPTKYGTALGSHLTFAMEQNGACKNPMEYIGKAE